MQILLLIVLLGTVLFANAQTGFSKCADQHIVKADATRLDSLTGILVNRLDAKEFYLIGEAHTFLANNDFQFSLVKALHKQGVYNVVNELPHATCFLFNQYLETGEDSLLTRIKPRATYNLLKKVRAFNQSQPKDKQVRYYGIDYSDSKYDYDNLLVTLKLIRAKVPSEKLSLDIFIDNYLQKEQLQYEDIVTFNETLNSQLDADSTVYKKHFGPFYNDLLLMASNITRYRPNRDQHIFKSFLLLHKILSNQQAARPKFLAFYGIGHLYNLGDLLLQNENSPVKKSVSRIGIQYINCLGGWTTAAYRDDGLYQLTKSSLKDFTDYCKKGNWQIGFFSNTACFDFKKTYTLDAVFIFNSYGDRKMNSWKFD